MESTPAMYRIPLGARTDHEDQAHAIASLARSLANGRSAVIGPLELMQRHDASTAARMLSGGRIDGLFVLHAAGHTVHRDTLMGAVCHALKCAGAGDLVYIFPPRNPQAPSFGGAGTSANSAPSFGYSPPPPAPTFGVPPSMPHVVGFGTAPSREALQEALMRCPPAPTFGFPPSTLYLASVGAVAPIFVDFGGPDGQAVASFYLEDGKATGHANPDARWAANAIQRALPAMAAKGLTPGVYAAVLHTPPGSSCDQFPTLASLYGPYNSHPDARCVIRRYPAGEAFAADVTFSVPSDVARASPPQCHKDWFGACTTPGMDTGYVVRDIPIIDVQLSQGMDAKSLTDYEWTRMALAQLASALDTIRTPVRHFINIVADRWYESRTFGALRLMGPFGTLDDAVRAHAHFGGLRRNSPRFVADSAGLMSLPVGAARGASTCPL